MAVSEEERLKLFNCLTEAHGEDVARTIMESLPQVDWHNLATKDDLFLLKDDLFLLKDDISALKEYVDAKFKVQSTVTKAQFSEIQSQFSAVQAQFVTMEANLSKRLSRQSWWLSLVFGGFAVSVLTAIAAGAPFG